MACLIVGMVGCGGGPPTLFPSCCFEAAGLDRDARGTIKWSKAEPAEDGSKRVDIAVPAFRSKDHIGIDRRHGLIRTWTVTNAARHDGAQLPSLLSKANTASDVWADTAYRSQGNEVVARRSG